MRTTRAIPFLLFVLLMNLVFFLSNDEICLNCSQSDTKMIVPENSVPAVEIVGPKLDCYIKKVDARIPWDNLTLYFEIVVIGLRPIAEVTFSYNPPGDQLWYNETMSENPLKRNTYSFPFDFLLPDRFNLHVWHVKYFASDIEGNVSASEIVEIALKWQNFPETSKSVMVASPPDIVYEYRTTGHTIEWTHLSSYQGKSYDTPEQYLLWRDGFLIEWLQWPQAGLSVHVDGLPMGTHTFKVSAMAGYPWSYTHEDTVNVDVVIGVPGEGSNPCMRYYLKEYYDVIYHSDTELLLTVFVEDPDGVENASMTYSSDDDIWYNVLMTPDNDTAGLFATSLLFENLSSRYCASYKVRYAACDSLGNWAATSLCNYEIEYSPITADCPVELYDTPDLWYLINTTEHYVTWDSVEGGLFYSLYEDGYIIRRGKWRKPFTINVDGFNLGDHIFRIRVVCGGWSDSDTVTVHVVEQLPFRYNQDSVEPLKPLNVFLTGIAIVGPPAVVLVLMLLRQKRSKQVI